MTQESCGCGGMLTFAVGVSRISPLPCFSSDRWNGRAMPAPLRLQQRDVGRTHARSEPIPPVNLKLRVYTSLNSFDMSLRICVHTHRHRYAHLNLHLQNSSHACGRQLPASLQPPSDHEGEGAAIALLGAAPVVRAHVRDTLQILQSAAPRLVYLICSRMLGTCLLHDLESGYLRPDVLGSAFKLPCPCVCNIAKATT